MVTSTLFPLLFLTLELPKRIINDAIGATSSTVDVMGYELDQLSFLMMLCVGFLLAVLAHGLMKMRINTMKGVLAERMLRRLRYTLIARILRFPSPYFERVSQGEIVGMITAESEPMGGLMGDMLSQPVLQAGQMITILTFLFLQSVWFGIAAIALIPLQAWLIPMLQRQINQLNKKRILQVRALAGEIGESAAGAATLRVNGGWRYRLAMVTDRLGKLFDIRFQIYQKKFFMKFLNNFIGQLTPFFFYSVGGVLVLQGSVSLGALVAALAAYKDLSSPWKELLAYYNQTQDMALRWEVVTERFAPAGMVREELFEGEPDAIPPLTGDIALEHVTVRDADGQAVLSDLSAVFPGGQVIGIAAPGEEDRRALADLLTRDVLPSSGSVRVGSHDLSKLHQRVIATRIGHATSRPQLFQGSFGDNVLLPLKHAPLEEAPRSSALNEALRSGNSPDAFTVPWVNPSLAGAQDAEDLRRWWLKLIEGMGRDTAMFRRGLDQSFDATRHQELANRLATCRAPVMQALSDADLCRYVHMFEPETYNPALPVAENLLFATPSSPLTEDRLAGQTAFLQKLRETQLDAVLVALGCDVLDLLRQIFGMDGTDHPLFQRLGLTTGSYETALLIAERSREAGAGSLTDAELAQLLIVPFRISAEQIGPSFDNGIRDRILELRTSHGAEFLETLDGLFVPISGDGFLPGRTVLENVIFGVVSAEAGGRGAEIRRIAADALIENGAQELVVQLIYDLPIALEGANLPAQFAEPLAFSRATIKRPDILLLDQALSSYPMQTQITVFRNLRQLLPETTLIYLGEAFENEDVFDAFFELKQGRLVHEGAVADGDENTAAADLARKLAALRQSPMFSSLDRRELRLLAFGARWYTAEAGETVFLRGDDPSDGAYTIVQGEAGLYREDETGAETRVTKVGAGQVVGELGLIRQEPRALTMRAEGELLCLRIGPDEFLAVVENDAATAFKLLQVVAGYVAT